jgi:hypothetical protein
MSWSSSAIFYRGPSQIDGRAIAGVLTGLRRPTRNPKTGPIVQSWILPALIDPVTAVVSGADVSVCGDCPQRPALGGSCYVNVGQAPLNIYRAIERGTIADSSPLEIAPALAGRTIRVGSYGDPVAIPIGAWRPILDAAKGHVGYTHQWRRCDLAWRDIVMASIDSPEERAEAKRWGWRTFRIRCRADSLFPGEVVCPASQEAGHRRTCETCGACDGAHDSPRASDVAIVEHGPRVPRARWALPLVRQ